MTIELFLYTADVLPKIATVVGVFFTIAVIVSTAAAIVALTDERERTHVPRILAALVVSASCVALSLLVPSRQTLYLMAGAHYAKQAVSSKTGEKLKELLEKEIDNLLKDASK